MRSKKFILTPFFVCLILALITCFVGAVMNYLEDGFSRAFRLASVGIVIVVPGLIWLEQTIVKSLPNKTKNIVLLETIALILFLIIIGAR